MTVLGPRGAEAGGCWNMYKRWRGLNQGLIVYVQMRLNVKVVQS